MVWKKKFWASLFCLVTTVVGVNSPAQAGIIHFNTPDEMYQALGMQYESVGWLQGLDGSGNSLGYASGVLVAPNWVLSVAHYPSAAQSFNFGFGNFQNNPIQSQSAVAVYNHPSYAGLGQGYDLALFQFANPFNGVTPANLYLGELTIGTEMTMVGYGQTGFPGGALSQDGNKRGGTGRLDRFGVETWTPNFFTNIFREPGEQFYRELGMQMAPGDSGGGFFIDGELAGIYALHGLNFGYGGRSSATRLDHDWIRGTTSAVPEPSSIVLLLVGGGLLASRRSRS